MNPTRILFAAAATLCIVSGVHAQNDSVQADPLAALDTIELDKITVLGDKQELALRIVKIGLENERSNDQEDANKVVCWLDAPTGTYLSHLYCGTNAALDSLARASRASAGTFIGGAANSAAASMGANAKANYYVSQSPVSPGFLHEVMGKLGPADLNREIVAHVLDGGELPNNVPTAAELDRFAQAYRAVKTVRAEYDSRLANTPSDERKALVAETDDKMAAAISEAGLTVDRYNHISALTEEYSSLQQRLAQRIK